MDRGARAWSGPNDYGEGQLMATRPLPLTTRWTHRKELFVASYLEQGCGATAARAAGYADRAAKGQAWKLLNHDPKVIAAVEEGQKALQEREETFSRYARLHGRRDHNRPEPRI